MLSATMTILGAIVTILGPILAAWALAWIDRKHEEATHAVVDEVDTHIKEHLEGNRAGLINLSHTLERLQREAERKHRHP